MPRDNFQTAAQGKRAQTHPGGLPKMRRQSWEAKAVGLSGQSTRDEKAAQRKSSSFLNQVPFKSSAEDRLAYAHEETTPA